MARGYEQYGVLWPKNEPILIEMECIRRGGRWTNAKTGKECGAGLFTHYRNLQSILWPEEDHHRWSDLALQNILDNPVVGIMGPASSGKTHTCSKYALCDYWCFPNDTCILVSSTDVRGLELKIWGDMKDLFNRATARFDFLPGHTIDYLHTITTDEIDEEENRARVLKRGIICIPCMSGNKYVGLGKYIGIKHRRLRLIADEAQLMGPSFLDSIANLSSNPGAKFVILGNPIETIDPLGRACEPKEGWESLGTVTTTSVWETRFRDGKCVNYIGHDTPNNDDPNVENKYPYLITKKYIQDTLAFWGKDSFQYHAWCDGAMTLDGLLIRIINKALCKIHHALERAQWSMGNRTRIYACDAAWGGQYGDRCVAGWCEFGLDINNIMILRVNKPVIVPVSVKHAEPPEDQIAKFIAKDAIAAGIPPERIFYDSTGRGTLGSAFARIFRDRTPVPIEFGGRPTTRPVRYDLYVEEDGRKRLKRCDEHYRNFVSELWFSWRYIIESDQMRELPEEIMMEGIQRKFDVVGGNVQQIEPKDKMKERTGFSPDLADWLVTAIEGARRHGFKIEKLGASYTEEDSEKSNYLDDLRERNKKLLKSKRLTYA